MLTTFCGPHKALFALRNIGTNSFVHYVFVELLRFQNPLAAVLPKLFFHDLQVRVLLARPTPGMAAVKVMTFRPCPVRLHYATSLLLRLIRIQRIALGVLEGVEFILITLGNALYLDWVICAPGAFFRCVSRFSGSLSGISF